MKDWLVEHKIPVLVMAIIAIGGFYYFYVNENPEPLPTASISLEEKSQVGEKETETETTKPASQQAMPEKIMVDVKGQIKLPGVYQANADERVIDVISRAGGLTDKADQGQVNFAEHVQDEMIIYIPAKGEEGAPIISSGGSQIGSGGNQKEAKININKADETELQNLPGIGPAKAAAIIEYRNTNGPFKAIEDLKNISGIGDKTFDKLKDLLAI
ncbi:helix-hairpin-helix domain-containing protein [Neobacillus drentensis]|uniref:helix-hairpin-helix domain-containing protein n=1 Tax=Neobacillus drentensis TaxID=220684 RepID=UPI000833B32F|nr:helix-hairpin-helix domain-containing protein [Neobacillus drentensis]